MVNRFLVWLTRMLICRVAYRDGIAYAEQYHVCRIFGVTFSLNRFLTADTAPFFHSHNWTWGRSLLLSGGYTAEILILWRPVLENITEFEEHRGWSNISGDLAHRIYSVKPNTWTLFIAGPEAMNADGTRRGFYLYEGNKITHRLHDVVEWWQH